MKKEFIIPEIKAVALNPERDIMAVSGNLVNKNAVDYTKVIDDGTKAPYDYWSGKNDWI